MSTRSGTFLIAIALAACLAGCDKPEDTAGAPTASTAPEPTVEAVPTASASASAAVAPPSYPCPEGSEGEGTFKKPCVAKGPKRLHVISPGPEQLTLMLAWEQWLADRAVEVADGTMRTGETTLISTPKDEKTE